MITNWPSFMLAVFSCADQLIMANIRRIPAPAPVVFYIVAHPDDWIYFTSSIFYDVQKIGKSKNNLGKLAIVYLTSGDAGRTDGWWQAREEGAKAATRFRFYGEHRDPPFKTRLTVLRIQVTPQMCIDSESRPAIFSAYPMVRFNACSMEPPKRLSTALCDIATRTTSIKGKYY